MQPETGDILQKIIHCKKETVIKKKYRLDQATIEEHLRQDPPMLRAFGDALRQAIKQETIAIIAELKKASPSKGILKFDYDPQELARKYERHGATCLSVLTEENYFLGSEMDLQLARAASQLPVLRKDFIIDCYQIYESRFLGADCILLIVAALSSSQLTDFFQLAKELNLDVIVEVANKKEVEAALTLDADIIGINNRDLRSFSTDLETTATLQKLIPGDRLIICESGIRTHQDVEYMRNHNVRIFLIGEVLIRAEHAGAKLTELLGRCDGDT